MKANDRNEWFLWGDSFSPVNGELYVWRSGDITGNGWTPLGKDRYTQPLNAKHPTIAPITAAEHAALLARWGAPAWNRIKSYNFPDHLIRHAGTTARIDPYPFDPYADAQWRLRPGLANASGLSLESVNAPGRYLRHANYVLALAANDGSATFAADATFYRTRASPMPGGRRCAPQLPRPVHPPHQLPTAHRPPQRLLERCCAGRRDLPDRVLSTTCPA